MMMLVLQRCDFTGGEIAVEYGVIGASFPAGRSPIAGKIVLGPVVSELSLTAHLH